MRLRPNGRLLAGLLLIVLCAGLSGQTAPPRPADADGGQSASGQSPEAGPAAGQGHSSSYIIGDDDLLEIHVWKEPELSRSPIPVRSDGKISIPLAGEIQAAGRTPLQLETEITSRLKEFITDPVVTVIVQKINSEKYNIMGEVTKPGSYALDVTTTVMDAIATAGGFRDFAKKGNVYVLRENASGSETRLKFNYNAFVKGKNPEQNIRLQSGDTVVVP